MPPASPTLSAFCRLVLTHATFTVGGGSVTTVALERDIVERFGWLSLGRFRALFGLARITPGTSILALVTGLGWDLHRGPGAALALTIAAVPGAILAAFLAAIYQAVFEHPLAQGVLAGAAAAVCGLIAASIWRMVKPYLSPELRLSTLCIFLAVLAIALLGINPFPVFILLGILGYALPGKRA